MPIYEYRCSSCGHQQEFLQKLSDAPLTRCTKCGRDALSKMVTAAGFQLKGSGWYATDFRNSGSKAPAKPSEGKPGDAAKPESKPEAKPEGAKDSSASSAGAGACPACS